MSRVTDQGYLWVLPFACCFINATLFGGYRSHGIIHRILSQAKFVKKSTASWPFSLCMTVIHLTGPVAGAMSRNFPVKWIMFTGCLLAALGSGLCYFASSIYDIILFMGIIQGFGVGLTFVQIPTIINQHFVKFRATANGIALAGGTIGALSCSFLVEKVVHYVEPHDCFLLLSGAILVTLPVCQLLEPSSSGQTDNEANARQENVKRLDHVLSISKPAYWRPTRDENNNLMSIPFGRKETPPKATSGRRNSVYAKPIESIRNLLVKNVFTIESKFSGCDQLPPKLTTGGNNSKGTPRTWSRWIEDEEESGSIVKEVALILIEPFFVLIAMTHLAYFWGCITFAIVIIDYSVDKQIEGGMHLINAYASGDLLGRLSSGCFIDKDILSLKYLALLSLASIGIFLKLTTLCYTFNGFATISVGLGFSSGVVNVLLNTLFCRYLGTDRTPIAFGVSAFLCGLITLLRPVAIGSFRDSRDGSYDGLFNYLSLFASLIGSLWLLEPFILRLTK